MIFLDLQSRISKRISSQLHELLLIPSLFISTIDIHVFDFLISVGYSMITVFLGFVTCLAISWLWVSMQNQYLSNNLNLRMEAVRGSSFNVKNTENIILNN